MQKVTYEYKGIKISIESNEKAARSDVEVAINNAKDALLKVFDSNESKMCNVSYRHEVPKVLSPKDIAKILCISEKSSYDLIRRALLEKNMFRVINVGRVYKIPRDSFLSWLEGVDSL